MLKMFLCQSLSNRVYTIIMCVCFSRMEEHLDDHRVRIDVNRDDDGEGVYRKQPAYTHRRCTRNFFRL